MECWLCCSLVVDEAKSKSKRTDLFLIKKKNVELVFTTINLEMEKGCWSNDRMIVQYLLCFTTSKTRSMLGTCTCMLVFSGCDTLRNSSIGKNQKQTSIVSVQQTTNKRHVYISSEIKCTSNAVIMPRQYTCGFGQNPSGNNQASWYTIHSNDHGRSLASWGLDLTR